MRSTRLLYCVVCLLLAVVQPAFAQEEAPGDDSAQVMHAFKEQEKAEQTRLKIDENTKHRIMFYMGVPLILFLVITIGLGVGMAVFGKPYFVAHMVFAGFSLTLALAHAVVGVVWFNPF